MQIINVSLEKAYENVNSLTNSKIPCQFPDIPVITEIPEIPRFSRKWEPSLTKLTAGIENF